MPHAQRAQTAHLEVRRHDPPGAVRHAGENQQQRAQADLLLALELGPQGLREQESRVLSALGDAPRGAATWPLHAIVSRPR